MGDLRGTRVRFPSGREALEEMHFLPGQHPSLGAICTASLSLFLPGPLSDYLERRRENYFY